VPTQYGAAQKNPQPSANRALRDAAWEGTEYGTSVDIWTTARTDNFLLFNSGLRRSNYAAQHQPFHSTSAWGRRNHDNALDIFS
jgi:hypothetical protein